MNKYLGGTTKKFTWISSGQNPSGLAATIRDGSETLVSSTSMTDSGAGFYFAAVTLPSTPGYYVKEMVATIGGKPYNKRETFKIVLSEVD